MRKVLSVEHLTVKIRKGNTLYEALSDIHFAVEKGEILGIIGESGCGKSITSLSVMGLLPKTATITSGEITLEGKKISGLKEKELAKIRGKEMSMIFQEPMTALNPLMTVGKQIAETYRIHHDVSWVEAKEKALAIMGKVGLSRVEELYENFPHQLSGGMKQRIVIAIALINNPALIIADEPTTALDVTIQHQILRLLKSLNHEFGSSIMLISHDLGVIREICDRMVVMYAGKIVEEGATTEVLKNPHHPYTKGLLASLPTADKKGKELHTIQGLVAALDKRSHVGCAFAQRCPYTTEVCFTEEPPLMENNGRKVWCHHIQGVEKYGE